MKTEDEMYSLVRFHTQRCLDEFGVKKPLKESSLLEIDEAFFAKYRRSTQEVAFWAMILNNFSAEGQEFERLKVKLKALSPEELFIAGWLTLYVSTVHLGVVLYTLEVVRKEYLSNAIVSQFRALSATKLKLIEMKVAKPKSFLAKLWAKFF